MNFPFISTIYHLEFPTVTYDGSWQLSYCSWNFSKQHDLQYSQYSTIVSC